MVPTHTPPVRKRSAVFLNISPVVSLKRDSVLNSVIVLRKRRILSHCVGSRDRSVVGFKDVITGTFYRENLAHGTFCHTKDHFIRRSR